MSKLEHQIVYNFNSEDCKSGKQQQICICCLVEDVNFIKLSNCKHVTIFEYILKPTVDVSLALVCYICHSMMVKFEKFILQAQNSVSQLQCRITNFEKSTLNANRFSYIEINSATNSEPIKFESKEYPKPPDLKIETEIKVEHENFSDTEYDVITVRKKSKPTKKSRTSLQKMCEGKIRLITLSTEEMLLDRKDDSTKKSYLNLPFKCDKCLTGFDHELTLKDHVEKRHGNRKGSFRCEICESVLSTKTSFDEHNKRHYRRYECMECLKRYNNVYSVLKHYNELHGRVNTHFACKLCVYTTESHRSYRYHMDKHRSAKVECAQCGSSFVNNTSLRMHMFTIHGQSSRIYACEQCGKRYRAKSGLAAHLASHSATPLAYCAPCRQHFRTPAGLRHHLRTHSKHVTDSDKRFKCDECGIKFLTRSSLAEHMNWVHLNNTKHACNKCTKVFKNNASLKKHKEFVHEKKRPPRDKICDHCGRGFTTLSILQGHIRTHTGERPLRCPHCPATFAHSAALYTHNKLLHAH